MHYQARKYRSLHKGTMHAFQVKYEACDIWIGINSSDNIHVIKKTSAAFIKQLWQDLYNYIILDPVFFTTLTPHEMLPNSPSIVQHMIKATLNANVGPMASVAGAFSQFLGEYLYNNFIIQDLIIENGGDIWSSYSSPLTISIYAGKSPLSNKIAIQLPEHKSLGICTSSATVGPSLSFGQADAITIIAKDAAIADAFATSIGNKIHTKEDIVVQLSKLHSDILGCVIIIGNNIGAKGDFQLIKL